MSTLSRGGFFAIFTALLAVCVDADVASAEQSSTTICLSDGTKIVTQRFETRNGNFYFYVPGSAEPLEYPASAVKGINVSECQKESPSPVLANSHFGIHGSNTIGERLMPMLIDAYGQKQLGARPASKPGKPEEQEISLHSGSATKAVIDFQSHGSGTSAKSLLDGSAIIGMSSRRANEDERKEVASRFNVDLTAPGNEHVLALDGLAVIVNQANPVRTLRLDQIAQIFSGAITNWADVGGANAPIRVLRRDDKSGTYDTFKFLVLDPAKVQISPSAQKYESSESLSDDVAKDPNAIGFIGLPYVNNNRALQLSSSCGLSSAPSRYTIKSEQYPLARRLYLYSIGAPSEPTARDILQFALSDSAQPTVTESGFIDQSVEFEDGQEQRGWVQTIASNPSTGLGDKEVPTKFARAFGNVLDGVNRTSIMFRFEPGSAQLDTRALQDVQRLARYLSNRDVRTVFLAGFADTKGGWAPNLRLSAERAATVANALAREGVKIPRKNILNLSYMAPVACNDSDSGMAKNRRVEVWIAR